MGSSATESEFQARRYLRWGLLILVCLVFGFAVIAGMTVVSGAVIAQGQFVVESQVKRVQHPTGGVVAEIRVRDGTSVRRGDILIVLDGTQARANMAIVTRRLDEAYARIARLVAERDGLLTIAYPVELTSRLSDDYVRSLMDGETRHFNLRREAREGQRAQLMARIEQLERQRVGLGEQENAKASEIALMVKEIASLRTLWNRKLISLERITAAERDSVRLKGELGELRTAQAQVEGQKAEINLQIIQIDQDLRSEVSRDLRDLEAETAENLERRVTVEDELKRLDLKAPQDGIVHQQLAYTVGGVVGPGETIMMVVPDKDTLYVEARVAPQDVDQIVPGRTARLRLSAFNYATTPEILGSVEQVSADLITDERSGVSYYKVKVGVSPSELGRLKNVKIVAGMPVEAFLETPSRTILSYLLKPVTDQIARAFREE